MNIYEANEGLNKEQMIEALIETLERDSGKKVFTLRILGEIDDKLESVIVFEDTSVLLGLIFTDAINGKLTVRIKGNYI